MRYSYKARGRIALIVGTTAAAIVALSSGLDFGWATLLHVWVVGGATITILLLGTLVSLGLTLPRVRRLRRQEAALGTMLNHLPGVVFRCRNDGNWTIEFASDGCLALTGYQATDFIGRQVMFDKLIHQDDRDHVRHEVLEAMRLHRPFQSAFRIVTAGGDFKWTLAHGRGQYAADGTLEVIEGFLMDITERRSAEQQALLLSSALEHSADIVVITDQLGIIEYVNQAFVDATGYTRTEALGQRPSLMKSGRQEMWVYQQLWDTLLKGEVYRGVFVNRRKNGDLYHEEKTIMSLKDVHGQITHFISHGKDITERMQAQERLSYLAHHDVLTDLPNRALLVDRLTHALAGARRTKRMLGLLFLDLDRFKIINDSLGHGAGDLALKIAARRLSRCVRTGDTVARLGGDEFVVLLENLDAPEVVSAVAQQILEALTSPFDIDEREFSITASIGISLYPIDGSDAATLLRNADIAMYRAKDKGRNNYQFHSADAAARGDEPSTPRLSQGPEEPGDEHASAEVLPSKAGADPTSRSSKKSG